MKTDMEKYYEILGLKPGASPGEIKAAYRDLARVWHPDRFSSDPRLQAKAQEKLKGINEAYEKLRSYKYESENVNAKSNQRPHRQETEPTKKEEKPKEYRAETLSSIPIQQTRSTSSLSSVKLWLVIAVAVALIFIVYNVRRAPEKVSSADPKPTPTAQTQHLESNANSNFSGKDVRRSPDEEDEVAADPNKHDMESEHVELYPSLTASISPSPNIGKAQSNVSRPRYVSPPEGYFTVGSTKDEILAIQGTPDRFTDNSFRYGSSVIYFRDGRVTHWEIYYPKLRAKLIPATFTEASYITVGSTKDDVLSIQGTPDRFTANTFHYGSSQIRFVNDRVVRWEVYYPKLKVRMASRSSTASNYFTVGSTKDDVIMIQGTPDRFTGDTFYYGSSQVHFVNDRVTSWEIYYPKLKVKMKP